ncbi:MAG: DUF6169 family protein [Runella sp.]
MKFWNFSTRTTRQKIPATILSFLADFFRNQNNVLIYVCESLDGRQLARKKIFDKWFKKYATEDLEQYDFTYSTQLF